MLGSQLGWAKGRTFLAGLFQTPGRRSWDDQVPRVSMVGPVGFQFLFFSVHRAIGTRAWKIALHVDVLCIGKNANSYHCFALGCWASWGSHLVFWKKINDFIERTYP